MMLPKICNCLLFVFFLLHNCYNSQSITQQWKSIISPSTQYTFNYFFNECVGSGHGSLALREDWQKQLKIASDSINFKSVRFHGILDDDVGSVNGVNDYSFINIDIIYDYLLSINMKPFVEISWMPDDFASGTNTIWHYKGNLSPPKDWNVWYSFIQEWMQHLINRYGINEVSSWKFEVWNEPGNFEKYMSLYMNTSRAIKSIDKRLNVGGPATMQLGWIDIFLGNVTEQNIPIDFVSSHLYPTDPEINKNDGVNAFYNYLKSAGSDVLNKYKSLNLTLYLSEYNSGLYGANVHNHDDNYASSFMVFQASKLQALVTNGNYGWMSYWTFSDIFEENGFGSQPFHNEYGMQTIRGIKKPIFRALQLLYNLGSNIGYNTTRIDSNNDNGTIQVYLLKNDNNDNQFGMYIANWNIMGLNITTENLQIELQGNGQPKICNLYRIDKDNVNPLETWQNMGSPTYPNQQQFETLNKSAQFVKETIAFTNINSNTVMFNVTVPSYGVVVLDIQY